MIKSLKAFFLKKKEKGFTLIELLVVIAIIGLLSTIVMVAMNTARTKARDARAKGDFNQIGTAAEMFYDSNTAYPAVVVDVNCADGGTEIGTGKSISSYMNPVPSNNGDATNGKYYWCNPTNTQRFCVYAESDVTTGDYIFMSDRGAGTVTGAANVCP